MLGSVSMAPLLINLGVEEPMTSTTCGHIIVEMIKFIVHQKLQIPYPYERLKFLVNQKSIKEDNGADTLASQKHYRNATAALNSLDYIFRSLRLEIDGANLPREVCLLFGATPLACREMYRIILPTACHKQQCLKNCSKTAQKVGFNVLRLLATSESLQAMMYNSMPPMNMYVLLKKEVQKPNEENEVHSEYFIPSNGCRVPSKSKIAVIDIGHIDPSSYTCCNSFHIFQDPAESNKSFDYEEEIKKKLFEIKQTDTIKWYQSSSVLKGFKDCLVNGSSITNSWL